MRNCRLSPLQAGVLTMLCMSGPAWAGDPGMPAPAGEHPRLLFTQAELPAIRVRAQTSEGRAMLATYESVRDRWVADLAKLDAARLEELKKDNQKGFLGAMSADCRNIAFLHIVTGDAQAGEVAARLFRIWLSSFPPDEQIVPVAGWGDPNAAQAYDWIYELLTPDERARTRKIFASMVGAPTLGMFGKEWWAGGPTVTNRVISGCNWFAIFANSLILTDLALEGEPGYNLALLDQCVSRFRLWLSESISPDGALYEGMSYASGYGTHFVAQGILAMRLRGVDMAAGSNLSQLPFWLAYETLPWGYESFEHNQTGGHYGPGPFTTFVATEYPELGRWMWRNFSGTQLPDPVIALVKGIPQASASPPTDLPLSHWFSARGLVVSRSGWGERDAHFLFITNPVGAGHTHADQGSFCFASNGTYFIADSGVVRFASSEHNLVHIDGQGQGQVQGGLDAYIRSVDSNAYAEVTDADLKLSYERVLATDSASWWWREYNPVERADRRALFVRGVTGPLLVIADDLRKDTNSHAYDWIAHVPGNNPVTVDGRQFRVFSRFGGKFAHTLESGCEATLVATSVPAGTYHGWALVSSEPSVAQWASNDFFVNGQRCPYNTTYFGRGHFREGWTWLPLLPGNVADIPLPAGKLEVKLRSVSGGRVALAVFTRDLTWKPEGEAPPNGGDFVVLGVDSLVQGSKPWLIGQTPQGVMEGAFLAVTPPALRVEPPTNPSVPRKSLHAVQSGVDARFLVVMAPHDQGDGRTLTVTEASAGQVAVVRSAAGVDLVAGVVDGGKTRGEVETDACVAVVSRRAGGQLRGYALVQGTRLSAGGQALCSVTGAPAHVVNDGRTVTVRGAGRTRVRCLTLGATRLVVNGKSRDLPPGSWCALQIPQLPDSWTVQASADGRVVDITGDGPLPLKVQAREDADLRVNGISRYFLRDAEGWCYPTLAQGSVTVKYRDRPDASALKALQVDPTQGEVMDLGQVSRDWQGTTALRSPSGRLSVRVPTAGPGKYRLTLGYASPETGPVQVSVNGVALASFTPTAGNHPERTTYRDLILRGNTGTLELSGPAGLAVYLLELVAEPRPLPAGLWRALGSYPGLFEQGKYSPADLRADLMKVWPPEQGIDLAAAYPGPEGKELRWLPGDSQAGVTVNGKVEAPFQWTFASEAPRAGVNFIYPLGNKAGHISYAVTFITSPEEREAELAIAVDWWARAFLNGQEVRSSRSQVLAESDGAQFNGDTLTAARVHLKAGVNTLLVKVLGGSGSSSFVAYLTDPGDLRISPSP